MDRKSKPNPQTRPGLSKIKHFDTAVRWIMAVPKEEVNKLQRKHNQQKARKKK